MKIAHVKRFLIEAADELDKALAAEPKGAELGESIAWMAKVVALASLTSAKIRVTCEPKRILRGKLRRGSKR